MLKDFKAFILRGNVVDLAIAVIIGAAVGAVVTSLVEDVITPIIGAVGGQPDFSALTLGPIRIGNFLNAALSLLIIASVVYFLIVAPMNRIMERVRRQTAVAEPPAATKEELLLTEIRDLLRQQRG